MLKVPLVFKEASFAVYYIILLIKLQIRFVVEMSTLAHRRLSSDYVKDVYTQSLWK